MNRILLFASLTTMLVSAAHPADAAVFERDWQTPGDGLLTYDDVNQREWLDLSVSRLDQFPEARLENAVAEIAPGGLFEGFTWAKRDDVTALAQSAGIDTSTTDGAINQSAVSDVISLLGVTYQNFSSTRSVGYVEDTALGYPNGHLAIQFYIRHLVGRAGLAVASTDILEGAGLMLYRAVPEPGAGVLMVLWICLSSACRYRTPLV